MRGTTYPAGDISSQKKEQRSGSRSLRWPTTRSPATALFRQHTADAADPPLNVHSALITRRSMSKSILWTNECNSYDLAELKRQTRFPSMVQALGNDMTLLTELSELLTQGSRVHHVTRMNLLLTGGRVALEKRAWVEEAMHSMVGNKLDWRIITTGMEPYEKGSFSRRIVAALCGNVPTVWIKISF